MGFLSGSINAWAPPDVMRKIDSKDPTTQKKGWLTYRGPGTHAGGWKASDWAEWAFACWLSVFMGAVILGCGAALGWPLRALSASVLSGVEALGAGAEAGSAADNGTARGAAGDGRLLLQGVWDVLAKDYGHVTTSPAFPGALSVTYFFSSCMPYMAFDMLPATVPLIRVAKRYKVQQEKPVQWPHVAKTVATTLYMTVGLQLPGLAHQLVTQGPWPYYVGPHVCLTNCSHMRLPELAPSVPELVLHLFLCLWLMDLLYFTYHRHHHQRTWRYGLLLYKHVHGIHHEWRAPFAWCTQYLHPIELAFTGLASILSPIIISAHPSAAPSPTHPNLPKLCRPPRPAHTHHPRRPLPSSLLLRPRLWTLWTRFLTLDRCGAQVDDVDLALHLDPALCRCALRLRVPRLAGLAPALLPRPAQARRAQAPRRPPQVLPLQLPALPDLPG